MQKDTGRKDMKPSESLFVILVIDDLQAFAGTEYVFFQQAKDLKAMAINVTALSANGVSPFWLEKFMSEKIEVKGFNNNTTASLEKLFREIVRLVNGADNAAIVHIHALSLIGQYIANKRRNLRCPIVISDNSNGCENDYWYSREQLSTVYNIDALVVLSEEIADRYKKRGASIPIIVKPNKVELPLNCKNRQNVIVKDFAYAGRISIEKGWHIILLGAFQFKNMDFNVHFYGDGNEKEALVDYAKMLNINKKIFVHNPYLPFTGIDDICSNNYCFIFPSFIEGFPITPLEALIRGKKIILSDIPGHREISSKQVDKVLYFKVGDPVDLAGKMQHVLLNNNKYNEASFLEDKFIKKLSDINCLITLYKKLVHCDD